MRQVDLPNPCLFAFLGKCRAVVQAQTSTPMAWRISPLFFPALQESTYLPTPSSSSFPPWPRPPPRGRRDTGRHPEARHLLMEQLESLRGRYAKDQERCQQQAPRRHATDVSFQFR